MNTKEMLLNKISKIPPELLGVKKVEISPFKKLGMDYSNINYLLNKAVTDEVLLFSGKKALLNCLCFTQIV